MQFELDSTMKTRVDTSIDNFKNQMYIRVVVQLSFAVLYIWRPHVHDHWHHDIIMCNRSLCTYLPALESDTAENDWSNSLNEASNLWKFANSTSLLSSSSCFNTADGVKGWSHGFDDSLGEAWEHRNTMTYKVYTRIRQPRQQIIPFKNEHNDVG